jgi:aldehyde dehydrogenase (NAD+)
MERTTLNTIFSAQKELFFGEKTKDVVFRKAHLKKLKSAILENENEIYSSLFLDLHKSKEESFFTEVGLVLNEIDLFVSNLSAWASDKSVLSPLYLLPSSSFIKYEPLGVCLNIVPFNYPFQLTFLPLVAAIGAGNCAIVKGSEHTPNTNKIIAKIIASCFEPSYICFIEGEKNVSEELVRLPFDLIFFTGSTAVGKKVMSAAAENLTPVILELGGKSPCIVDKTANLTLAARRIVWGKFINAGQTCIAPDFLIVHSSIIDDFLVLLVNEIELLYSKNSITSPYYGRIINNVAFEKLVNLLDEKEIYFGGQVDKSKLYISPTILYPVSLDCKAMQEEIFGPILPILTFDNDSDLDKYYPKNKPLSLYLFGDNSWARKILNRFPSGGACINDTVIHFSNKKLPFGGVGASGMGHYHGKSGFLAFSHQRGVVRSYNWIDLTFRYPPYTLFNWIKKLFRF